MDMLEAMIQRRSVRTYTDRPIEGEVLDSLNAEIDAWFEQGVAAALLAPTAINQQKFHFEYLAPEGNGKPRVRATTKRGTQTRVDLGIAKCHFELAAGKENFDWA